MKKVLLLNGSPRKNGNTQLALQEVSTILEQEGIASEIAWIGTKPVRGCIACMTCKTRNNGKCVFDDDICNSIIAQLNHADAFIVGAPVYYGTPTGQVLCLLQRMFYAGAQVANKPAAAIAVCRRGGATAAFQTLQMPLQMNNALLITSQYWNIVYGREQGEAKLDQEGMQTMRQLARNMAWALKMIEDSNVPTPQKEPWTPTHFIR